MSVGKINYERIITITIIAVLVAFLVYKIFWEVMEDRRRINTRETKQQNQTFMTHCYRHELSNWASCRKKLDELNASPYRGNYNK